MKKVLILLLAAALALGGIGFAHGAVTAAQDDLIVYPTLELGDPGALDGLAVRLSLTCGDYLRWDTAYPFGGEARTGFSYGARDPVPVPDTDSGTMYVYHSGGFGSAVSGGFFRLSDDGYGLLLQAVADETPRGETRSMELRMADHVAYYQPELEIFYEDDLRQCFQSFRVSEYVTCAYHYEELDCYRAFLESFRFPVQPDQTVTVDISRDDRGRICRVGLQTGPGPRLDFLSDVTAEGIWFVPLFRDEGGTPLPYESPQGHGVYFIPWKSRGTIQSNGTEKTVVTPDVENARLCFPLDEALRIDHMRIDGAAGTVQILTSGDGMYVLTLCDLESGAVRTRLPVLPFDAAEPGSIASFRQVGDDLLICAQGNLALTDAAGEVLYLTAPDIPDQSYSGRAFDPDVGDLHFDGKTLVLSGTSWSRDGALWVAAWRQGELLFYGEYSCSLMRGNDHWYYSDVAAEGLRIEVWTDGLTESEESP